MKCPALIVALFVALSGSAIPLLADPSRPNVVFILGDDQAWTDYGFMGHPVIQTPNLDRLAGRSLVFEHGYVAAPLCRPSLASMVTGLFPFQHGVVGNDVNGKENRAVLDIPVREEFHRHPSFIRELVAVGYLAHQSGKWWEGSYQDGGFTHGMTHGDPARGGRHGDDGLVIGREGLKPVTGFIDRAVKEQKPFLLWYAPFLPHTPHNPPERLLAKYRKDGVALDVAKYYAMCEWFDETCGELLAYLDSKGLADNTMVIFMCDNGWAATSTNAGDPNQKKWKSYALRSKSSPFENGIRTPIMISWPGKVDPGRSGDLAHAIDLFPTITAATGVKTPAKLPGINLLDKTARGARERVFGVTHATHNMTPGNPDDSLQYLWCVERDWKLIQRFHGKDTTEYRVLHNWDKTPVRLFRIREDPRETKDLAAENPEQVQRLKGLIKAWREGFND
ncbi:MAG: sulfatase-like hydrolase/transferase [Akkermansiaceae bacterium]|jgi:arylsulfatase A-like enzyme|nr:sulfatase-like hydrolase/transferase [Akkermansiaceae bacterium]